jgi:hypothetical protein
MGNWIFQANPTLYDIDSALRNLRVIHWRVPQYTAEIRPGDAVLIWRSGEESGIVGVGRVSDYPRESRPLPEELAFYVDQIPDVTGTATLVPVHLTNVSYISKSDFARGSLANHQIVTAPMGTVFPLTDAQWNEFREIHPEIEAELPLKKESAPEEMPSPFAWNERRKSVFPMPRGYDHYLASLEEILQRVEQVRPDRNDLHAWISDHFEISEPRARLTTGFLVRFSLMRVGRGGVGLTPEGQKWLETQNPRFLVTLLHARFRFIGEMLAHIGDGRTPEEIREIANDRYDCGWKTLTQINRRRGWLQSAGAIMVDEGLTMRLTELGQLLVDELDLAWEPTGGYAEPGEDREVSRDKPEALYGRMREAQELGERLKSSARDTSDPDNFEKIAAEAFGFLGFDSAWLGGSGKTDVLLVADLGPDDGYRVIIDCKTTSRKAVPDGQIDWVTLDEHRAFHEAHYVGVLGVKFAAERVHSRAEQQRMTLIEVDSLSDLLVQHATTPLGLSAYRTVFEHTNAAKGVADVAELADEEGRLLRLAAHVVCMIHEYQGQEGVLTSSDLYWLLKNNEIEEIENYSRDEIQQALETLSAPPVGLLISTDSGVAGLGSLKTASERLRLLADMVAGVRV